MLCVLILYINGRTYSLKSTPNDRFFEKLFMAILFTLRVFARNLLRGNRRRYTFPISFWCLAWDSNPDFSSNKPTHYLLDHGDFTYLPTWSNKVYSMLTAASNTIKNFSTSFRSSYRLLLNQKLLISWNFILISPLLLHQYLNLTASILSSHKEAWGGWVTW